MDLQVYSNKLSIIVTAHGYTRYLEDCLKSIKQPSLTNYEVILVWNNPVTDINWLDKYSISTFIQTKNMSISQSLNIAHSCVRGEYTAQLNDDVELPECWIDNFSKGIEEGFDFVGPIADNCNIEQTWDKVFIPGQHHKTYPINQLCGFCVYGKTETFKKVGYYDENLPNYAWVDADFNYRANQLSLHFGVRDDVIVKHKRANLTPDILAQVPFYKQKYGDDFVKKHFAGVLT